MAAHPVSAKPTIRDAGGSHTPGHAATKKKKRKKTKVVSNSSRSVGY